ncbi:MAG: response regulator [Actinobacteria bacterium]|nr:response regulator [Actinomycetota bacterium]
MRVHHASSPFLHRRNEPNTSTRALFKRGSARDDSIPERSSRTPLGAGMASRIHVVDDDTTIRQMVTLLMVEEGYEVAGSKDGEEAVRACLLDPPDLLILDMMMPGMDGYGVLSALDTSGLRDRMRVLALTARSSEQDRERILELGADGYMAKPFESDDLVTTVTELLALSHEELVARRMRDKDTAHLLSQLESLFDT